MVQDKSKRNASRKKAPLKGAKGKKVSKKVDIQTVAKEVNHIKSEFLEHVILGEKQFNDVVKYVDELRSNHTLIIDKLESIESKMNQPILVPIKNGEEKLAPLNEVVGYIWNSTYILREGNILVKFYRDHNVGIKRGLRYTLYIIGIFIFLAFKKDLSEFLQFLLKLIA